MLGEDECQAAVLLQGTTAHYLTTSVYALRTGERCVHYTATREELLWRAAEIFSWIYAGELAVRIGAEFELVDAADARALETRQTTGKLLLLAAAR